MTFSSETPRGKQRGREPDAGGFCFSRKAEVWATPAARRLRGFSSHLTRSGNDEEEALAPQRREGVRMHVTVGAAARRGPVLAGDHLQPPRRAAGRVRDP